LAPEPNRRVWISSKWLVFKRPSLAGFERPLTSQEEFEKAKEDGWP
jgi:hypothetical protein